MLDLTKLINSEEIIFGPFLGEFGWEIMRWAGFIKGFKKKHPNKKIIVCTRENRQDLYYDSVDSLELFNIEGDYKEFIPKCYDCLNFPDSMYSQILENLKDKYPNALIFDPRDYRCDRNLFDVKDMDFNWHTKSANKNVIETILQKKKEGLTPILIHSIDRKETDKKNWGTPKWKQLFNLIENSKKFFVFVTGIAPCYYRSKYERKDFYNLEDYSDPNLDTSVLGLTIEAIRHSKITICSQTYTILLSNLLKTPTFFWGNDVKTYSQYDNPFKTKSIGVEDYIYNANPTIIFNHIKKFTK